jgi:hypothetical protein
MRGRSRKGPNPLSRTFESNGPDVKIRGTASHIADKYVQLARDAQSSGDPVAAENYFQHAEHYYRILAAAQPQFQPQQGFSRADDDRDEDGEDADFEGDGASGFNGAQEPPFAVQQQPRPYEGDRPRPEGGGSPRYESRPRSDEQGSRDQGHGQQGQPRYPRDEHGHAGQQRQNPRYDDNRRPPYENQNRGGNNNYRGDGNSNYRGGGQQRDGEQRPRYDDRRPGGDRQAQNQQGDRDRGYGDRQPQGDRQRPAEIRAEAPRPEMRAVAEQPRVEQPRIEAPRAEPPRSFDREPDPGLPAFITGPSPIVAVNGHDAAPEPAAEPAPRAPARRRRPYKARGAEGEAEAAAAAAPEAVVPGPAEE